MVVAVFGATTTQRLLTPSSSFGSKNFLQAPGVLLCSVTQWKQLRGKKTHVAWNRETATASGKSTSGRKSSLHARLAGGWLISSFAPANFRASRAYTRGKLHIINPSMVQFCTVYTGLVKCGYIVLCSRSSDVVRNFCMCGVICINLRFALVWVGCLVRSPAK